MILFASSQIDKEIYNVFLPFLFNTGLFRMNFGKVWVGTASLDWIFAEISGKKRLLPKKPIHQEIKISSDHFHQRTIRSQRSQSFVSNFESRLWRWGTDYFLFFVPNLAKVFLKSDWNRGWARRLLPSMLSTPEKKLLLRPTSTTQNVQVKFASLGRKIDYLVKNSQEMKK